MGVGVGGLERQTRFCSRDLFNDKPILLQSSSTTKSIRRLTVAHLAVALLTRTQINEARKNRRIVFGFAELKIEEWDSAIPLKFPYLICSVEYNGFLIAMPLFGEAEVVAYNLDSFGLTNSDKHLDQLQEIFKDPFYNPIECHLTSLDDHGRMCLLYSGFSSSNSSKEFWGCVAVFQVSISNSTDNPVVTAVLEAVEDYNMQDFVVLDTSIYSTFIIYDDLSMDDTAADASLTNSTLSGLDSRRGMGKHAAEFVTDVYMHKKPKTTLS